MGVELVAQEGFHELLAAREQHGRGRLQRAKHLAQYATTATAQRHVVLPALPQVEVVQA